MGGQTKRQFSAKNDATGQKNILFEISFSYAHLPIETKLFCFYQNFISSAVQRFHGGTKKRYNKQTTNKQQTNNKGKPQTIIIAAKILSESSG